MITLGGAEGILTLSGEMGMYSESAVTETSSSAEASAGWC